MQYRSSISPMMRMDQRPSASLGFRRISLTWAFVGLVVGGCLCSSRGHAQQRPDSGRRAVHGACAPPCGPSRHATRRRGDGDERKSGPIAARVPAHRGGALHYRPCRQGVRRAGQYVRLRSNPLVFCAVHAADRHAGEYGRRPPPMDAARAAALFVSDGHVQRGVGGPRAADRDVHPAARRPNVSGALRRGATHGKRDESPTRDGAAGKGTCPRFPD